MAKQITFAAQLADKLSSSPSGVASGYLGDISYKANIIKRDYRGQVDRHYAEQNPATCKSAEFDDFGVKIVFEEPVTVSIYDDEWRLDMGLKALVERFGPVFLENVMLGDKQRGDGQRNIFPSLAFHVDRGKHFENQYSMFVRDPLDDEQRFPRKSGTLLISNRAAVLQGRKEGKGDIDTAARHDLFTQEPVEELFDSVLLYQPWAAPEGVGEICFFDNRTVLHASYYKGSKGGYKIGVRYLY